MSVARRTGAVAASAAVRGKIGRVALFALLGIGVAALGAVAFGDDLAWRMARPEQAALLDGASIPDEPDSAAIAADLGYLKQEIPRRVPYFASTVDSGEFVSRLRASLEGPGLDGEAGLLALVRAAVLPGAPGIGTGHTKVPILQRPLARGFYPVITYLFDDGLWIVYGHGDGADLVGWQVLEIGGMETSTVIERARPYVAADNPSGVRDELPGLLSHAVFLRGLGLASEKGDVGLTLRSRDGATREVVLEPVSLATPAGLAWGRSVQTPVEAASPADPRPERRNFWLEYRPEDDLLYARINRIRNADDETLAEFGERLAAEARRGEPAKVVIDLRTNGGGDNQLVDGFVDALAGDSIVDRRGALYTLIGRRTFSAAGALATALERRTRTLFAGEPSGFTPNHLGDAEAFRLPETSVIVEVVSRYWADGGPYDRRAEIDPEIRVPFESRDHFEHGDPVLDAVVADEPAPRAAAVLDSARREEVARSLIGRYRFSPHRVLEIEASDRGPESGMIANMTIHGTGTWAQSRIYALPNAPDRFGTDIRGVFLVRESGSDGLSVEWHGTSHQMPPLSAGFRLPIEQVRAGVEDPEELRRGIAAFRELAAAGALLGSRWEFALNGVGYDLLRAERVEDAVAVFSLSADLFPTVANVFDSLAEARLAAGDTARAVEALHRALEIDPGFAHARELLGTVESAASP